MGDTIQKPGGDAGVVRVHETNKAVAASVDSSANYCYDLDPLSSSGHAASLASGEGDRFTDRP